MTKRISLDDAINRIKHKIGPDEVGVDFAVLLRNGSMSFELFMPREVDNQEPHTQDELYIIISGEAHFQHLNENSHVKKGDVLFVPAGDEHRFHKISSNFMTWVVFWGPSGGESPLSSTCSLGGTSDVRSN